ncbi:MAG TPA: cysteine desulfurase family protein [Candidatus Saccharimonadales bacterium]|nr:cysteine desulfurase family protein [Candidatus Saccharimonadales bacterium]
MEAPLYFDHAAATPMDPRVASVMLPYFTERFFNPSATYLAAVGVRNDLDAARSRIARVLGSRANETICTAGATEANNLVIRGVMGQYPDGNVIVSSIEHDSVLLPGRAFGCKEAPVTPQGIVDMQALRALIDDKTALVSVMYANNEVGSIQPVRQIALMIADIRKTRQKTGNLMPLYLHTDAAQAANYLDLHVSRLGVDFMTLNGSKIYGPKQTGILFASSKARLQPQILGGGQERGQRAGTENVAGVIGLAEALDITTAMRQDEVRRLKALQDLFFALLERRIPSVVINGSRKTRLPNNVHITLPGKDNERLLIGLDERGIMAAAGSACSASNEEPSHVLKAMGISDHDAQASLRFSMGRATDEAAVRRVVDTLSTIVAD